MKITIIAQFIPTPKGGIFYQLYTVNYDKPVKIGGIAEDGYMLTFYSGIDSNLAFTTKQINELLQGDVCTIGSFDYQKI